MPGWRNGKTSGSRSPHTPGVAPFSLANIQERFDWMVLISPLWAKARNGWALSHEGKVLVE